MSQNQPHTAQEALKLLLRDQEELEKSLKLYRSQVDANPDAYRPALAMTLFRLAVIHKNLQRRSEAEDEYHEAIELYRKLADKDFATYGPLLARAVSSLATMQTNRGLIKEAEPGLRESLELFRQLAVADPRARRNRAVRV